MTGKVVILCWRTPSTPENNARKVAEFLGAEVVVVCLESAESIRQSITECTALIVHIDTLAQLAEALVNGIDGLPALIDSAKHVFIYGFTVSDAHASILRALSS